MSQVILTQEQADLIVQSHDAVQLRDPQGNVVGYVNRDVDFTDEEIAEAKRRMKLGGTCYTTEQVIEYLRSLEQS
jgi:hypothetical protein